MRDKESYFISLFPSDFIGDDGAVVGERIYSSDLFCEGVHFRREWLSLEQIAYKSLLVNISDAIAMNAHPRYMLLNVKLPSSLSPDEMRELAKGFLRGCEEYGIQIIGGDTVAGETLDIAITLISHSEAPLFRSRVKIGDLIGFTGDLGSVGADLQKLLNGESINPNSKFITPTLRDQFLYRSAPYLNAAMDISDGLSKDLSRLSKINKIGFEFTTPLDRATLCSGEEYEILFSVCANHVEQISRIAQETQTPITLFAKAVKGTYQSICKEHHFE